MRLMKSIALASVLALSAGAASAMTAAPVGPTGNSDIQNVWCAAGLRLGPFGACLAGGPNYYAPRPVYVRPGYARRCWIDAYGYRRCN